ncbi:AAA family ATPase [Ectopseudomonas mendocina]|uniref:AAA family ATPase n=1 Tax=Ectopseudomonas mendocina TaxID=300 RepID=A0ABZ2RSP4_ECTME
MRISSITISNFQGLRHAALVVSEPVLLVSGNNGAGKSSLMDAISMALTGEPRRVSKKKDLPQLITEGQKKSESHITWIDPNGDEQASWAMLPKGNTAPLIDTPYLPFVLDASKFAALDGKDRRKLLFDLTGSSASPNEAAKRLLARGADATLVEKIKPMLRAGFPAAAEQAKEYAAEARGAWKAITGEAYGSEKAEDWEPEAIQISGIDQAQVDQAFEQLNVINQDMAEAQQTLGGHLANAASAVQRQQRIDQLRTLVDQMPRRKIKLAEDEKHRNEWDAKLAGARRAAETSPLLTPLECPHCKGSLELHRAATDEHFSLRAYVESEKVADPEAAKRVAEYNGYLESALRAVQNSRRDLDECTSAADQLAVLEQESATAPTAEAIANAEQMINELRQERDKLSAKHQALQDAMALNIGRETMIAKATSHHEQVKAWVKIAEGLAPDGIPGDILKSALEPVNTMLSTISDMAKWAQVHIRDDIEITYGGRLYGLLSESEKWRCDALLAVTIARQSGLGIVTLDRFDVLQPSARPQILTLLRNLTQAGEMDTAILTGTMKEALPKVPSGIQQVWIEGGQIAAPISAAA